MAINSPSTAVQPDTNNTTPEIYEVDVREVDILTYHVFINKQDTVAATIRVATKSSPIPASFFIDAITISEGLPLNNIPSSNDCLEAIEIISSLKGGATPVLIMAAEFFTKRDEHPCIMTDIGFHYVTDAIVEEDTIMIPLHRHVLSPFINPSQSHVEPPVLRYRSNINTLLNELRCMGFYLESINPGNRYIFRAFAATTAGYIPCTVVEFEEVSEQLSPVPQMQPRVNNMLRPTQPAWVEQTPRYN